ncbi:hypothetical protein ACGFJ5_01990 [Micromonospora echinaurantiaca]
MSDGQSVVVAGCQRLTVTSTGPARRVPSFSGVQRLPPLRRSAF